MGKSLASDIGFTQAQRSEGRRKCCQPTRISVICTLIAAGTHNRSEDRPVRRRCSTRSTICDWMMAFCARESM
jgi:hypothetical protein